jgi:hypothetical protein
MLEMVKKALKNGGYSLAMERFFANQTIPASSVTLALIKQKKDFFEIYMSYAKDVANYCITHPGLFDFSDVQINTDSILASWKKRYKERFIDANGEFVYPLQPTFDKGHFWLKGNQEEQEVDF